MCSRAGRDQGVMNSGRTLHTARALTMQPLWCCGAITNDPLHRQCYAGQACVFL